MSITPTERDSRGENREQTPDKRPGVRARLQSWLGAVTQRIRSAFTPAEQGGDTTESCSGQIRVAEQRSLVTKPDSAMHSEERAGPPPARGTLPDSANVDAKQDGETLRVYNPQHKEAFIASDTWTDIKQ